MLRNESTERAPPSIPTYELFSGYGPVGFYLQIICFFWIILDSIPQVNDLARSTEIMSDDIQ